MKTSLVVTSISGPNPILQALAEGSRATGWTFLVAGDRRSPADFHIEGCDFLDIESQRRLPFHYAALCPENSYVRKNIGFLQAVAGGAEVIVETDDDNLPLESFWKARNPRISGALFDRPGWANAYALFCDDFIYPRGFPLDLAKASMADGRVGLTESSLPCPIQQGLVDECPDVDAIYRLMHTETPAFRKRGPVVLGEKTWCPFNSQNTTFFRAVFPLLYLPAFCTFRATDIWRGLVAQRVLWSCGGKVSFHAPDVRQIRNPHDLLSDLELEVPVYLYSKKVASALEQLPLQSGATNLCANLRRCYETLADLKIVGPREPELVEAWLADLTAAGWEPSEL